MRRYSRLGWLLGWSSIAFGLCFGCTVSGKDNGRIELTFGTTLSIGTVTSKTDAEPSATLTVDDRIVESLTKDDETKQ